ncbi:MAG: MFS transporter [Clostridiaceae bacterium]|nr:MFS transporter [Clostridiaceae bacterium]
MGDFEIKRALDIAENGTDEQVNRELHRMVDVDRRVIRRKETIGYMLFVGNNSFNINGHKDLFVDSILKISFDLQAKYHVIAGIWDIVDDFIVSFIIEKTRTRWGKFIPYIFCGGLPYALIATLYWLLPKLLPENMVNDFGDLTKFFIFAAIDMLLEFVGNFKDVAIGGYVSTITPYPSDRRRLLAISSYFSIIYSRIPDIVVEFMLDFIKNGIVSSAGKTSDQMIKTSLMIVGPVTAIISGLIISWYASIAKERVHQKVEKPKIRESLRIVFSNRPVRMYILSNLLGSFGTGINTNDYYRQVLNMTTFETIAGIPSFFFQPIGFAKYNALAKRFSTKSLFMVSQVFAKAFYIPLWFYGRYIKTSKGKMFFQSRWAMLPVTAIWECIYATFWGVKSVSGTEIANECNDYIEWKYGYRNEATLSAASTLVCKIPARINSILQPLYKKWCHYDQTAYTEGREQPILAQKWIFAMATILPAILVLSSMIPMFWYDINKEKRDKMYMELNERRAKIAEEINKIYYDEEASVT